ncbi:DUF58 domain-containing protein [Streptomyces sp. BI20]|uniref:DUF58 domain-containing protein n=1 Tax=Streptomyces sp. BI20 TaxID=3403460 RepID=UPI003C7063F0
MAGARREGDADRGGARAGLSGLTTRGRSFLAAGVAAVGCAYVLGQAELLRVGILLLVLPLICVLALYRTRHRVDAARSLGPDRVPAGTESRVRLRLQNPTRLPTGMLMLQDRVPYVLGPRPRFVLDRVEGGGRREVSYRVRSDLRGRYPLGPLQLRLADPFGLVELTRSFRAHDVLTVVPRTEPLAPTRLTGESGGQGEGGARTLALAGEDDMIPRGYRRGDDLRRVHWRSTAKYGELMVRREEAPRRNRATVLLDTRGGGYDGAGPDSAFEWVVSAAASTLLHLLERGFTVRLLTDTGLRIPEEGASGALGGGSESAETAGLLLEALAVVDHSEGEDLAPALEALRGADPGVLIAFLGDLDAGQAEQVARMRRRGGAALAFVLDPADWGGEVDPTELGFLTPEERARRLREAGWTVVPVVRGTVFGDAWRAAGEGAGVTAGARGTGGAV